MRHSYRVNVCVGLCLLAVLPGCSKPIAPQVTEARVTVYMDPATRGRFRPEKTMVIESNQEAQRLASFFSGMGTGKRSWKAAPSGVGAEIRFFSPSRDVKVTVDSVYEAWSEGSGDFPLSADFRPYLVDLLEAQTPQGGEEP